MHRCTIRLCAWRMSRQLQISNCHFRLLSRVSAAKISSRNEQSLGNKRVGRKGSGRYNGQDKQREQKLQDLVFLDDLVATLEAHRDFNRASVIHNVQGIVDEATLPFKRPSLGSASSENAESTYERGEDGIDTNYRSSISTRGSSPFEGPVRRCLGREILARRVIVGMPLVREVLADQALVRKVTMTPDERRQDPHPRRWPAESVQSVEEGTKTRNTGFVRSVEPLEYTAAVIPIAQSWKLDGAVPHGISKPWASYVEDSTGDNYDRLSNEIRAFEAYMRLSPAEEAAAQLVQSDVTAELRKILSTESLTLLGSRSTGLATPTSDFNYRVDIDSPEQSSTKDGQELTPKATRSTTRSLLKRVSRGLQESDDTATTELIIDPVPMIQRKHRATGLSIQFQTMSPSQASQQYTAAYLSEFPSVRPLYILIRHALEIRDLTTVSRGGLGSYTIFMMVVAALKHSRGEFSPNDLGGQLLHVLDFYGHANLYENGLSVDPPRTFKKSRESKQTPEERKALYSDRQLQGIEYLIKNSNPRKPYLLCLQDPADAYNDLGRPSYAIKHVQMIFKKMHTSIKKTLSQPELALKSRDWSLLAPMVRADYALFEIIRHNLECCHDPDNKLKPENTTDDTVLDLLERRLKVYKGESKYDDLPSAPASTDPEPSLITKYKSEGWYPNEYVIKPHAKPKRSRRQMNLRAARMVAKRRTKREKKMIGDVDAKEDEHDAKEDDPDTKQDDLAGAKDEVLVAEETTDSQESPSEW